MATITEDYVSFETAKLLKEKGFDESGQYFYKFDSKELYRGTLFTNTQVGDKFYNAPTLQMAMKWLREVHNIYIELNYEKGNQLYSFQIWKPGKFQPEISSLDLWRIYNDDNYLGEWEYEKACESAIKYSLENFI